MRAGAQKECSEKQAAPGTLCFRRLCRLLRLSVCVCCLSVSLTHEQAVLADDGSSSQCDRHLRRDRRLQTAVEHDGDERRRFPRSDDLLVGRNGEHGQHSGQSPQVAAAQPAVERVARSDLLQQLERQPSRHVAAQRLCV